MEEMERDGIGLIRPEDKKVAQPVKKVVSKVVPPIVDANKAGLKAVKSSLEENKK